jgi:hypothetical protein
MKWNIRAVLFTIGIIVLATVSKLAFAPKLAWSGFSPLMAVALFSGMMVKDKTQSFILPLIALFISDALIEVLYRSGLFVFQGFYKHQIFNYALLLITTLIGFAIQAKKSIAVISSAIIAPTVFFLLSNFFVWNSTTQITYPKTWNGLLLCYEAGLPFYRNSLLATVLFLPILIISFNWYVKKNSELKITLA